MIIDIIWDRESPTIADGCGLISGGGGFVTVCEAASPVRAYFLVGSSPERPRGRAGRECGQGGGGRPGAAAHGPRPPSGAGGAALRPASHRQGDRPRQAGRGRQYQRPRHVVVCRVMVESPFVSAEIGGKSLVVAK